MREKRVCRICGQSKHHLSSTHTCFSCIAKMKREKDFPERELDLRTTCKSCGMIQKSSGRGWVNGKCPSCLFDDELEDERQEILALKAPADRITIDPNDFTPPRLRDIEVRNVSMPDLVDFFRRVNEFSPGIFEAIIKDVKRSRSQYPDGFGRD